MVIFAGGALDELQNGVDGSVNVIEAFMGAIALDQRHIGVAALPPDSMGIREGYDGVLPAMNQQNRAGRLHHGVDRCDVVKPRANHAF